MIERTYRCNLCHDAHDQKEMVGLSWAPTGERTTLGASIEGWVRDYRLNAETHLCKPCLRSIAKIRAEQREAPTP